MKVAAHIIVKGFVQGVGFRYFVMREANQYGLTGFVRNLYDGSVEVYIEGDKEIVDQFKKVLKKGSSYSRVDRIEVEDLPYEKKFSRFSVEF